MSAEPSVMQLGAVTASDLQAAFRGEIYGEAATMTDAWFAEHVAQNDVELARSPRWSVGGELSGAALLAFRGDRAWVGGFGVVPAFRGRGLARRYLGDVLELARAAGAATIELEVIAHNAGAIALYERGGFVTVGELIAWSRDPVQIATPAGSAAHDARAYRLDEVTALARTPATCWQREPRSVAAAPPSELVVDGDPRSPRGYAFVRRRDGGRASVLDAGASNGAGALLAELDRRFPRTTLMLINEPPHGRLHEALAVSPPWREFVRQRRMIVKL